MNWAKWDNSALVRTLVVALAILGTGADTLPIPLLTSMRLCEPEGEAPYAPSREDERDETPDDASDLAWPLLRFVARSSRRDRLPLPHSATRALEPLAAGTSPLHRRPHGHNARAVPLPITLCRLTC